MNFVDFVIDFYSHITSHVSQAFASCTHYTSYSLLNFVHVIVCIYGLTNQILQILWILCKIKLLLENLWRMQEILFLGNLDWRFLFFENHIITYSCILFLNFNALIDSDLKNKKIKKKLCFSLNLVSLCPFRLIHSIFRSIEDF